MPGPPAHAAHTGIAFKEGFCYNKAEAGGLFGVVPLLMGGHLLGVWSQDVSGCGSNLVAPCLGTRPEAPVFGTCTLSIA